MMKSSENDNKEGLLHQGEGKAKEIIGIITDDGTLEAEGKAERIGGKIQEKIGQIKKVIGK